MPYTGTHHDFLNKRVQTTRNSAREYKNLFSVHTDIVLNHNHRLRNQINYGAMVRNATVLPNNAHKRQVQHEKMASNSRKRDELKKLMKYKKTRLEEIRA